MALLRLRRALELISNGRQLSPYGDLRIPIEMSVTREMLRQSFSVSPGEEVALWQYADEHFKAMMLESDGFCDVELRNSDGTDVTTASLSVSNGVPMMLGSNAALTNADLNAHKASVFNGAAAQIREIRAKNPSSATSVVTLTLLLWA